MTRRAAFTGPRARARGFTLIELMIVTGVIAILSAVAIPAYTDYTVRANMSEVVLAASACRTAVAELYVGRSVAEPPGANGWGCEYGVGTSRANEGARHVSAVTTSDDGKVSVSVTGFGNGEMDGKVLTFTPMNAAGTPARFVDDVGKSVYAWRCGDATDGTTVPLNRLPPSCRG